MGRSGPGCPSTFYLGYLNTGWTDIFFYDGFDRSFAAPVTHAVPQSHGGYFEQQNADAPIMSRQDTPSNVSSATMQHIKGLQQEPLTAQTQRSWTKTATDVDLMHQSWTESTQDMERFHVDRLVAGITPQPEQGNTEGLL